MPQKIRLLQLSPQFPFPQDDGGKIGIANILKEFYKCGIDVTFFCIAEKMPEKPLLDEASQYADIRVCLHSTRNTSLRIANSLLLNHSIYIRKHFHKKIKEDLFRLLKEKKFDAVHSDHSCMAPLGILAKKTQNIPLGIRLHNIEWTIWKRYSENLPKASPKRLYIEHQAYLLKKAERLLYSQADVLFPLTEPDKARALELSPNSEAIFASAGVDLDDWMPDKSIKRNTKELVLATTYQWIHNVDAVRWFITEVMPLLRSKNPDISLTLIGKNAPEWLKQYKHIGVNTVGYVNRVQPYYNRAAVNISPLFVGGGIRIKILEAMAMQLPVVASPIAAEGINASQEDGLFLANNKNEFADMITMLINNPIQAREIGTYAREFISKNFTWEKNVAIMANNYKERLS